MVNYSSTKQERISNGKRQSYQQMVLGKLDSNVQRKNETGPLSYNIHKNKFKMYERPKCESIKILEEKQAATSDLSQRQTVN